MLFQKPFLHRIPPTYFFSLNGSIGFLRLYSLYCKIKKSLRMDWEERERERERYDSLVRYIFQSFAVSENAKQA